MNNKEFETKLRQLILSDQTRFKFLSLSSSQLRTLRAIKAIGSASAYQVSKKRFTSPENASRQLKRLTERGYLVREVLRENVSYAYRIHPDLVDHIEENDQW